MSLTRLLPPFQSRTQMKALYNEIDQYCCAWLSNLMDAGLITPGKIDNRSITELTPDDVKGYERVHFFAGIAGWDYALNLAGWGDEPVWTGSCPCQPFSISGQQKGKDDPRHLWPYMYRLIAGGRPPVVMGEQVAGAAGLDWFSDVEADLEEEDYSARAVVLPACSVGARHVRPRIYWLADTMRAGLQGLEQSRGVVRGATGATSTKCSYSGLFEGFQNLAHPDSVPEFNGIPRPVGIVRAFGNAIIPELAAEVIAAYMETREINQELLAA